MRLRCSGCDFGGKLYSPHPCGLVLLHLRSPCLVSELSNHICEPRDELEIAFIHSFEQRAGPRSVLLTMGRVFFSVGFPVFFLCITRDSGWKGNTSRPICVRRLRAVLWGLIKKKKTRENELFWWRTAVELPKNSIQAEGRPLGAMLQSWLNVSSTLLARVGCGK